MCSPGVRWQGLVGASQAESVLGLMRLRRDLTAAAVNRALMEAGPAAARRWMVDHGTATLVLGTALLVTWRACYVVQVCTIHFCLLLWTSSKLLARQPRPPLQHGPLQLHLRLLQLPAKHGNQLDLTQPVFFPRESSGNTLPADPRWSNRNRHGFNSCSCARPFLMPPLNALGKVSALALVPEPAQVVVTLTHAAVNHCRREACLWVRCFVPPQRRQQVEHFFCNQRHLFCKRIVEPAEPRFRHHTVVSLTSWKSGQVGTRTYPCALTSNWSAALRLGPWRSQRGALPNLASPCICVALSQERLRFQSNIGLLGQGPTQSRKPQLLATTCTRQSATLSIDSNCVYQRTRRLVLGPTAPDERGGAGTIRRRLAHRACEQLCKQLLLCKPRGKIVPAARLRFQVRVWLVGE